MRLNKDLNYMNWTKRDYLLIAFWVGTGLPAWFSLYYSVGVLPVGLAETIQNLTPFMTLLIGYYALNEAMRSLEIVNMCFSFTGVLVLIVFSQDITAGSTVSTYLFILGVLANILSALLFAIVNVIIRALKNLNSVAVTALYSTCSFIISTVILIIYRSSVESEAAYNLTWYQGFLLIWNGLLVAVGCLLYVKAFALDKAGRASSLWFLAIVVGYIFDILIFNYEMQVFEVMGSLIIIASSALVFIFKLYKYSD